MLASSTYKTAYHATNHGPSVIKGLVKSLGISHALIFWALISYFENLNLQIIYAECHKLCQLIQQRLEIRMIEFNEIAFGISHH